MNHMMKNIIATPYFSFFFLHIGYNTMLMNTASLNTAITSYQILYFPWQQYAIYLSLSMHYNDPMPVPDLVCQKTKV